MAAAQADSPEVITARFNEHAAAARVREIVGRFLPSLDLEASVSRRSSMSLAELRNFSTEISAKLTFPLYHLGTVSSQVRAARQLHRERQLELKALERRALRQRYSGRGWADPELPPEDVILDIVR